MHRTMSRHCRAGLVERGLVERGLVERGLVERGLVERGLVERGLVERGLVERVGVRAMPFSRVVLECVLVAWTLGLGACTDDDSNSTTEDRTEASGGSSGGADGRTDGGPNGTAGLDGSGGDTATLGGSAGTGTALGGGVSGATGQATGATGNANGGTIQATGGTSEPNGGTAQTTGGSGDSISGGTDSSTGGASSGRGGAAGAANSGGAGLADGGSAASGGGTPEGVGGSAQIPSDAVPSIGCEVATQPATGRYSIDVEGTEREYILKLPEDYDAARPYPLVLAWHGGQYDAEWVDSGGEPQSGPYFGVERAANGAAIFVAPQALPSSWSNQDGRDIAFVDAMLEGVEAELCIDRSRVFATGFSMGGIMTLTIGCERPEVVRAIAPMSGRLSGGCPDGDHSVAYWSSHGTSDTTITPADGEAARDEFVRLNLCDDASTPVDPSGCVSYEGCDAGYPVVFCTFDGVHEPAPFAGEEIWAFFSQF